MTAPATTQLNRIIQLVAELSRQADADEDGVPMLTAEFKKVLQK